jgi:hypothetical protein
MLHHVREGDIMLKKSNKNNKIGNIISSLFIGLFLVLSSCSGNGKIEIKEVEKNVSYSIELTSYNASDKFEMSLTNGHEIKVETVKDKGTIGLSIIGKNGTKPYEGSDVLSGSFTVTISESDIYEIKSIRQN